MRTCRSPLADRRTECRAVTPATPATPWIDLFVAVEPEPQAGPVAVDVAYRIHAAEAASFRRADFARPRLDHGRLAAGAESATLPALAGAAAFTGAAVAT